MNKTSRYRKRYVCLTLGLLPVLWPAVEAAEIAEEGKRRVLWVLAGSAAEADGSARHIEVIPDLPGDEAGTAGDSSFQPDGREVPLTEREEAPEEAEALPEEVPSAEAPVLQEQAASADGADRPLSLRERRARWRSQQEAEPGTDEAAVITEIAPVNAAEGETAGDVSPAPEMVSVPMTEAKEAPDPERWMEIHWDEESDIPSDEGDVSDGASLAGYGENRTDEGETGLETLAAPAVSGPSRPGMFAERAVSEDASESVPTMAYDNAAGGDTGDDTLQPEEAAPLFIAYEDTEVLSIEEENFLGADTDEESAISEDSPAAESASPAGEALDADEAEPLDEYGVEPAESEEPVQDAWETEIEEEPAPAGASLSASPNRESAGADDTAEPAGHPDLQTEAVTTASARAGRAAEEGALSAPAPAAEGPIGSAQGVTYMPRPFTLPAQIHRLEEVIMGGVQSGPFADRVDTMDRILFGRPESGGLAERAAWLTQRVIRDPSSREPSLSTRLNMLEYHLINEITQDAFTNRVERLERRVFDFHHTGALEGRLETLERAVYGDQAFEQAEVILPAATVFRISLNENVGSKTNTEGDIIHFTVQEDVWQDGVLVLPRGAQGSGMVTKVTRPKMFGRSGEIEIAFNQVFSLEEEVIPTVLGAESREKLQMGAAAIGASAVGALALGPVGLVGGLFVKGREAELPAGTELYIQTSQAVRAHGVVPAGGMSPRTEEPEDRLGDGIEDWSEDGTENWPEDGPEDGTPLRTSRKEVVYAFAVDTQDDAS